MVTFGPCAAQQSDVIFCQNPERTRVPCQPKTASGGGRSGIIRLKHIKVFSICVHPLMVPASDTHTNGATSWTRIMNGGNVFVCASMKGTNPIRCQSKPVSERARVKLKIKIVCWWHIFVMFSLSFHPTFCQWHFKYSSSLSGNLVRRKSRKNVWFSSTSSSNVLSEKILEEIWFLSLRTALDLTALRWIFHTLES